jgi:hypothetical protein
MYLLGSSPIPEAPPLLPLSFLWQRVDRFDHPVATFVLADDLFNRAPVCLNSRSVLIFGHSRRPAAPMA